MTEVMCNKVEKLNPPPFITTLVTCPQTRRKIYQTWSRLRDKSKLDEMGGVVGTEVNLLKGYIERKGTQLRLEKALMLTNRIYKLGTRWVDNRLLHEFELFDGGVKLSLKDNTTKEKEASGGKMKRKRAESDENDDDDDESRGVRLPSRQWCNWITYLMLRDTLILAKIKYECERAVKYWLGLISSSHHATDSLVGVGILSRMWFVSSSMVEHFINLMYPTVCKLSIHLEPTKAENWLKDFETPLNLRNWLESVLGFPFIPAKLSRGMEQLGKHASKKTKMESVLSDVFKMKSKEVRLSEGGCESRQVDREPIPSTSATYAESDEDLGIPVTASLEKKVSKKKTKKKPPKNATSSLGNKKPEKPSKVCDDELNEKWKIFFAKYRTKLKNEQGKKQFLVRIRKYLADETDNGICLRLKRLRKCIRAGNDYDRMMKIALQLKKYLIKIKS